jgi:hypothetical protein
MAPQSALGLIENPARPLELTKLKPKSIALHWEFMFTRSRYQTPDMDEQGHLLSEVAALVEACRIQTTMQVNLGGEQPEAKDQSINKTMLNSIRPDAWIASLPAMVSTLSRIPCRPNPSCCPSALKPVPLSRKCKLTSRSPKDSRPQNSDA